MGRQPAKGHQSGLSRHLGEGRRRGSWPGRSPRVAIVGAGFSGLCMGIKLLEAGVDSFTIYEKNDGVGGTWRENTYPGAACDVPSHLYSFSFEPRPDWTRAFSEQAEILEYLEHCADAYGLRPHLRLGTEVAALAYDDDLATWRVHTVDGEVETYDVVVSGLGQLNRPAYPDVPGLADFEGTAFHSARWDHDHDLSGERVAVIGNGASAVQFVPEIAPDVERLTIFQRSANWILPKPDHRFPEWLKESFARYPGLERLYRYRIYWSFESHWLWFKAPSRSGAFIEKLARRYLAQAVKDPARRQDLTPDYPLGCKRVLISNDYYPAVQRPNVEIVTDRIDRVAPSGVVTADGSTHEVDTIIFATGFQTTHFLAPLQVHGRDGRSLEDAWHDGAEAHLGITVAGFPNLFLLYGPNTNLGHNSIVFMIERQVGLVVQYLAELARRGLATVEVRPDAQAAFNRDLVDSARHTVWDQGCTSWYKTDSGRITNNWTRSTLSYWWRTRRPVLEDLDLRPAPVPATATSTAQPSPPVPSPG